MRLFFALWPPRATAQALFDWARGVAQHTGGRQTPLENIHLTLAFLGDADADRAKAAATRVRAVAHRLPIDQARYVKRNEMVWAGPERMPEPLETLVAALHGALRTDGFALEERPFAAHITLLRKARPPGSLPPLPALDWPVSEFVLVRSRTSPKGSAYESIGCFALG